MYNQSIGSVSRQQGPQHGHHPILIISIIGELTICSFASWVIHILIACRHPFMRYWQPLQLKSTATGSLPHPTNERPRSVHSSSCPIFGNHSICMGTYAFVRPYRHTYGNYRDTVANVDASESRCRCVGKIIARDLRLVACRLYIMAVTRPQVTFRCYSIALIFVLIMELLTALIGRSTIYHW